MDNEMPEVPQQTPEKDSDRRTFLRNSALMAGTAAAITATSSTSQAASFLEFSDEEPRKTLKAAFDSAYTGKIQKRDVYQVVDQILNIAGCPTCGLVGFDINLTVDPLINLDTEIPSKLGIGY